MSEVSEMSTLPPFHTLATLIPTALIRVQLKFTRQCPRGSCVGMDWQH